MVKNITKHIFFELFLLTTATAFAQNEPALVVPVTDFPKHELGVSWGAFPAIGMLAPNLNFLFGGLNFSPFKYVEHQTSGDKFCNSYLIGTFNASYYCNMSQRRAIGFTVSWAARRIHTNWIRSGGMHVSERIGWENYLVFQYNHKRTYYEYSFISLYFSIHAGFILCIQDRILMPDYQDSKVWAFPAFQLTPFGISIGKKKDVSFELGIGTQGAIKIGYTYKFKNRSL
jgi:hypothetical protein